MKKHHFMLTICLALGTASAFAAEAKSSSKESASAAPTDPQIAMIAVTANQVDVDAGKLATEKSANAEVKQFAELMIRDHTSVNDQATALVKRLNVTPEPSATSKGLKDGGDKNIAKLKKMSGAAFDQAYVEHEVTYHQQVLDAIDKTLIPNAKNAELKSLLETARPVIASHLDHAKHLQSSMK